MAFLGIGKKKEAAKAPAAPGAPAAPPEAPAAPKGIPVEQVTTLQKQGMSNYQIVQTLQQQGYSSQQIYDAINQASVKTGVSPTPAENIPPAGGNPPAPPGGLPPVAAPPGSAGAPPLPPPVPAAGVAPGIEETVEAIVEEKWKEISEALSKINEWKEATNGKINKLQQTMTDLKSDMDNLHKAIVAKIGEYDQNILSVGTEIKAMEKVFSKVLPSFTENVNELARVTKGLKGKKK